MDLPIIKSQKNWNVIKKQMYALTQKMFNIGKLSTYSNIRANNTR